MAPGEEEGGGTRTSAQSPSHSDWIPFTTSCNSKRCHNHTLCLYITCLYPAVQSSSCSPPRPLLTELHACLRLGQETREFLQLGMTINYCLNKQGLSVLTHCTQQQVVLSTLHHTSHCVHQVPVEVVCMYLRGGSGGRQADCSQLASLRQGREKGGGN